MAKKIVLIIFLTLFLNADFKNDCMKCHQEKRVDLRETFMNALLVYGGENNFKTALFYYCKNPSILNSVMGEKFVKKFLPLKPIKLSSKKLQKLIDIYWQKYKIIGNLK